MPPKDPQQQRRETSAPPDSVTPEREAPTDARREDRSTLTPDSLPEADEGVSVDEDVPLAAQRPSDDGGRSDHPTHDDDPDDDLEPGDYEEEIDEIADARAGRRARDVAAKS